MSNSSELRVGVLSLLGDKPAEITDIHDGQPKCSPTSEQQAIMEKVGSCIKEYLNAAQEMLSGKYAHLKSIAPGYLAEPGNVIAFCCSDGVAIRFEKKQQEVRKKIVAWVDTDLAAAATMLSQKLIQVHKSRDFTPNCDAGVLLELFATNPVSGQNRVLFSGKLVFNVVQELPSKQAESSRKPFCIASVRSMLELQLLGELVGVDKPSEKVHRFLSRTEVRLPVGWDCIELFPSSTYDSWKHEFAASWAEQDVLAAVVARQYRELQFETLDPNATARGAYSSLLAEFRSLLDSEPGREEVLQQFLQDHPLLLCPTSTSMWPKLALGANVTDFVFRDATQEYLLVEIEKSTHSQFRVDGHPRAELQTAIDQVVDWKRYLEDNLRTVQTELGLAGMTANPRSLVVIGRSRTLTDESRRKLRAIEAAQPRLRVMTYDDVYDNAKAVIENLLGPIWEQPGETKIYYTDQKPNETSDPAFTPARFFNAPNTSDS